MVLKVQVGVITEDKFHYFTVLTHDDSMFINVSFAYTKTFWSSKRYVYMFELSKAKCSPTNSKHRYNYVISEYNIKVH